MDPADSFLEKYNASINIFKSRSCLYSSGLPKNFLNTFISGVRNYKCRNKTVLRQIFGLLTQALSYLQCSRV